MNQESSMPAKSNRFLVPLLFFGLALIPVLYYGYHSELARWRAARGELAYDQGDYQSGIQLLEESVDLAPHDNGLQLQLASKLMEHGRADEALEIIENVITKSVDPQPAMRLKANCLLYLERAEDALITLKNISDYLMPVDFDEPTRLNELAYFRALAKKELVAANENINDAIEIFEKQIWFLDKAAMPLVEQTLAATTLVARQTQSSDLISGLLDRQIESSFERLRKLRNHNNDAIYTMMGGRLTLSEEVEGNIWFRQFVDFSQQQNLSVLLSVRALVYQDLGKTEMSDRDRLKVELLDHHADDVVERLPDDWTLMTIMLNGAMFLDTRAMVTHARIAGHRDALGDLDVSVAALQVLRKTAGGTLQNTIRDERGEYFNESELKRHEATMRSHRAQVLISRGNIEKAEEDLLMIEKLGFERDELLF